MKSHYQIEIEKRIAYYDHAATNPYGNLDNEDIEKAKATAERLREMLKKITR